MSIENVRLFYEKLSQDPGLQDKFKLLAEKFAGRKPEESQFEAIVRQDLLPLAREAGFEFTPAELEAYRRELGRSGAAELSEDELTAVVGGGACVCVVYGNGTGCRTSCTCYAAGFGFDEKTSNLCICVWGGGGGLP